MLRSLLTKNHSGRVYLDYAASTPLSDSARAAMLSALSQFANPSAIHTEGRQARTLVETKRTKLARTLTVRPEEVLFTGSGTESNNLALLGCIAARQKQGRSYKDMTIIISPFEHPSVAQVVEHLAEKGVVVKIAPVDEDGIIDVGQFARLLDESVVLVSVAYISSEFGLVQPVSKLAREIRAYQSEHTEQTIVFHTDAAQAPLWLPCQLEPLGVQMMSLDASKCSGPKGCGVLVVRHTVELTPVLFGGGQERGVRPATENTPVICGGVAALVEAQADCHIRSERVAKVRDKCLSELLTVEGIQLNGSKEYRAPNNINVSIDGIDGEFAAITLDEAGFAVATTSACSGTDGGGSQAVRTLYQDDDRARSTLRITLGEATDAADLKRLVAVLKQHIRTTRDVHATFVSD